MELEKTTVMSAIVWVAGVLAEVIFRDALSKSIFGIVLSVIIAVIVLVATYFIIDGINTILSNRGSDAWDKLYGYQERMFQMLNTKLEEQISLERSIYDSLNGLGMVSQEYQEKAKSMFDNSGEDETAELMTLEQAVEKINENTLNSAKLIAKYEVKNSESIKEILDLILERIPGTLDSDDNIQRAEGIGTGVMAEDSNSKELLENSRELVGTSKELLESTTGIAENIMLLVSGSKELSDINKEQLSKLLAIETAVNNIENVNPYEIKTYMDKVVTLINSRQAGTISPRTQASRAASADTSQKKPGAPVSALDRLKASQKAE